VALNYAERLEAYCVGFEIAGERGQRRDDIRPGLRVVGFERHIAIAFTVSDIKATILRLYYGGQNWMPS
jgi:plasmid stabilization system protein ParE